MGTARKASRITTCSTARGIRAHGMAFGPFFARANPNCQSTLGTKESSGRVWTPPHFRRLPTPTLAEPIDYLSLTQLNRLDPVYIPSLILWPKGSLERDIQVAELRCPRTCVDEDGEEVDRFVTDDALKSGRVFDRLHHREVQRIVPYASIDDNRRVYDVLTDRLRRRDLMDDFRDVSAAKSLEVSREECLLPYLATVDIEVKVEKDSEDEMEDEMGEESRTRGVRPSVELVSPENRFD